MIDPKNSTAEARNPALLSDLSTPVAPSLLEHEIDPTQVSGSRKLYALRRNEEELRIWAETPEPAWLRESLQKLQYLLRLEPGWDSYGGQPIKLSTVSFALLILEQIAPDSLPAPAIVPTPLGGVQLEWHEHGLDIEIEVASAYRANFYIADLRSGDEREGQIERSIPMENIVSQAFSRLIN